LRIGLSVTLAVLALSGSAKTFAGNDPTIALREDSPLGGILTDPEGRTLYLNTEDTPGQSNCYDRCAEAWPPLLTDSAPKDPEGLPGDLGVTLRKDGSKQVTYDGIPVYYWFKDQQPGDTTGQGVGQVWFVVHPDGR
jgi:predicted lipoprotein with Yx(FWY)xxD motif